MLGKHLNESSVINEQRKKSKGEIEMKKKLLSIVTTICLGILLVACGGQSGDTDKVIKLGINGEVNQIWKSV